MSEIQQAPESLRDTLAANLDLAEAGTLPHFEERSRDEGGRFSKEEKKEEVVVGKIELPDKPQLTTWKKDYLPLHEKLGQGLPLTAEEAKSLHAYNVQRENEYKTGVSTYRSEAENAKNIQEAMTPFLPELQSRGISPDNWIRDVGQAHYILAKGSPDQKVQLLRTLAQQYNVPLQNVQQGGPVPQIVDQLLQKISALESKVGSVDGWRNQMDAQAIQVSIEQMQGDKTNYPYFEAVKEPMAQLLEQGVAKDLPSAYKFAVAMNEDLKKDEVNRLVQESLAQKDLTVRKAKDRAVSPKSATPSGQVTTTTEKDRRALLEASYDEAVGGRV
jgi:hypothetical protein